MAKCHQCSAKIIPGQKVCRACGEPFPGMDLDEDATDPMLGRTIGGNFEVLELIGEGAMGRVYLSRQVSLDKRVAIKVLHQHLANDPKVVRRFHREARAASRLSHPNSLQIMDFGEDDDGTLYIAMEYLDGDDLLTVIEHDAPFTPRRLLDLMSQVLLALDAAHRADIIHRDLKPENVVVLEEATGHEHVKVCDFGIAKIQEAEGGSAITVSGFVCGTPEYMAPEQARGERLDRRADIYAAGCMLYQMLTGELPFSAESALGIITKHLTESPIKPSERRPDWRIPAALDAVTLKAMAKQREDRYGDADAMSRALTEAVESTGDLVDKPLGCRNGRAVGPAASAANGAVVDARRRRLSMAAPLIFLGAAAIGVALLYGSRSTPTEGRPTLDATPVDAGMGTGAGDGADGGAGAAQCGDDGGAVDAGLASTDGAASSNGDGTAGPTKARGPEGPAHRPHHRRTGSNMGSMTTVETTPPDLSPGRAAYEAGRRLFLENDIPGAIRRFEEAARAMPRDAQVHKQLGRAYMRSGEVHRAAAAYRRYLDLAPDAADREIVERIIEQSR